jgi:hypothetical protein
MSSPEAIIKQGPNVPAGCILVNEIWRGSNFEAGLTGKKQHVNTNPQT